MLVLGVDPGLANFGWAAVELGRDTERVLAAGNLRTSPSSRKARVLASSDTARRARELRTGLAGALAGLRSDADPLVAVCAESMSYPRAAKAAHMLGVAWGIAVAEADVYGVPIAQASPQQVKATLTGRKDASKDDVLSALVERYGEVALASILSLPKTHREHPADALAAVVACLDHEAIQAVRRLVA